MHSFESKIRTRDESKGHLFVRGINSLVNESISSKVSAISAPMIQRKAACPCGGGCPACRVRPTDLGVSEPHGLAEIEADRTADKVMRLPVNLAAPDGINTGIDAQTLLPNDSSDSGDVPVSSDLNNRIDYSRTGGSALDTDTRSFFEPRFGTDLGNVNIHTGRQAAELSRNLSARAFTIGSDIFFGAGEYQPETHSGKHLIAHELTHVRQGGNAIRRFGHVGIHDDLLDQFSRETGIPREEASQYSREYEAWLLQRQAGTGTTPSAPRGPATGSVNPPSYGASCSGGSTDPCRQSRCRHPVSGINADLNQAIIYVDSAIAALGANPLSDNAIRALDWYFNSHTAEIAATVLTRLTCIKSELQDTLTNSRFGCHPNYPGRAIAYVCVGSKTPCQSTHTNVCLTDRYFGKSNRVRAEVLIHECGHRAGLSAGSPDIYDFTWQFMYMDTADSLMNTDSYALFAPAVTEGVRTTVYGFPYLIGLSAGSAIPGTGENTWQARLYLGTEFQNPVLGVFNPTIGIGLSLIGETSTGGTSAIASPPSFLASLVGGFRLTDPRPGSAGSGYASFFGGPAIVVPFPTAGRSSDVRIGAEAGMAIGYRWRWLDVSLGVNYAYDPTREAGMEHLFIPNLSITFAPEFTQFPSSH